MPRKKQIERDLDEVSDHASRAASEPDPVNFQYRPANQLPDPHPKHGFRYGWIRYSIRNEPDQANWAEMQRDGWVPVLAASVPELSGMRIPGSNSIWKDHIEFKGNVLCIIPEYKIQAREKYYRDMNSKAMRDIKGIGNRAEYGGDGSVDVRAKITTTRPLR